MLKKYNLAIKLGPSLGISARNWAKMMITNGLISIKKFPRASFTQFVSIIGAPFRLYERLKYNSHINNLKLKEHPIFILGH
ncbi:MAG: hypothetical protein ACTSVV_16310 [Promethearchaeota archaeon]